MRSLIFFINLMTVSLLQFQLTQSMFPEQENSSDPLVGSCMQSAFLIDYLQRILPTSQYPGNVFVLTDCLTSFDFQELRSLSYSPLAIVDVSFLYQENMRIFCETKAFVILDLTEAYIEHATKMILNVHQYTHKREIEWQPTISIIWKSEREADEQLAMLQVVFNSSTLYFDTNIFIYFLEPSSNVINVWEVYSIKHKKFFAAVNSFFTKELTSSSSVDKFQLSTLQEDLESYAKRRRNFHMESLTASVKFDPNFQDWSDVSINDDKKYTLTGGYVAALYWDLKLLMNFSEYILLGDSPQIFSNGTLAGITVGQLNSGEIDLTLNQISFSQQRAKAFTFLQPTYNSLTYVFFKQPSTNSIRDVVIAAFEKELWITLIGVWAILVISTKVRLTLKLLDKNSLLLPYCTYPRQGGNDQKFAKESALWSVAAFCQKTWYLDPASFSLKMKFLIGSIVGFISYTAYSGSIVSSLAVNKIPVKNFVDLINFNFIFTVHEHSEPYQTMLKGMIKSYSLAQDVKTTSTLKEVSHLYAGSSYTELESSKNALLSPADMFYKTAEFLNYSSIFICNHISSFSAGTYQSKSAMLVKKTSQFKEVLNLMLVYLRQRGHIYRNIYSYNTRSFLKCIPKDEQGSKVDPATWTDLFTIFLVLFIGFLSAALLLVLEIVCICYCDWKSRKELYKK